MSAPKKLAKKTARRAAPITNLRAAVADELEAAGPAIE
jgi:hypothetical protein